MHEWLVVISRELDCVLVYRFLSDSRNTLNKFDKNHVHMTGAIDLIYLGLHGMIEQWSYFSSAKVVITDSCHGDEVDQSIQAHYFRVTRRLCLGPFIEDIFQHFQVVFDH